MRLITDKYFRQTFCQQVMKVVLKTGISIGTNKEMRSKIDRGLKLGFLVMMSRLYLGPLMETLTLKLRI